MEFLHHSRSYLKGVATSAHEGVNAVVPCPNLRVFAGCCSHADLHQAHIPCAGQGARHLDNWCALLITEPVPATCCNEHQTRLFITGSPGHRDGLMARRGSLGRHLWLARCSRSRTACNTVHACLAELRLTQQAHKLSDAGYVACAVPALLCCLSVASMLQRP